MSRITSLECLFLANATNDFTFYNGDWSTASSIKEVWDEYLRLTYLYLCTITCLQLDAATAASDFRICNKCILLHKTSFPFHISIETKTFSGEILLKFHSLISLFSRFNANDNPHLNDIFWGTKLCKHDVKIFSQRKENLD